MFTNTDFKSYPAYRDSGEGWLGKVGVDGELIALVDVEGLVVVDTPELWAVERLKDVGQV